jgi:hypothetical protein
MAPPELAGGAIACARSDTARANTRPSASCEAHAAGASRQGARDTEPWVALGLAAEAAAGIAIRSLERTSVAFIIRGTPLRWPARTCPWISADHRPNMSAIARRPR